MPHTVDYLTAEAQCFAKWYRVVPRIVVTSASDLALTNTDEGLITFTGSTAGQTVTLGLGTSYQPGHELCIHNASTQPVTVRYNDTTTLVVLAAGQRLWLYVRENATTNGVWDWQRLQDARDAFFNNASNNFTNNRVQGAIEELDFRDLLAEPTGFPNLTSTSISFNNGTLTFQIAPTGANFTVWLWGRPFVKTTEQITITNNDGAWFFYYTKTGVLTRSQTAWDLSQHAPIAYGIWDATNQRMLLGDLWEERHGFMPWQVHLWAHRNLRTQIEFGSFLLGNYTILGDGTNNADAQVGISGGLISDEDIAVTAVNSATPTNPFEQKLSTILWAPVLYKSGATGAWREKIATAYALFENAGGLISYNLNTAGTWTTPQATSGYFVAMWILVTTNRRNPVVAILGQNQSATLEEADNVNQFEVLNVAGLGVQEFKYVYRLIFQTDSTYTNTPKARLVAINEIGTTGTVTTPKNRTEKFSFGHNGGVGTRWLELNGVSGANTDQSPAIMRWACKLVGLSFTNKNINTGFTIELYKNGTAVANRVLQWTVANKQYAWATQGFTNIQFAAGDRLSVRAVRTGNDAADLVVECEFERLNDTTSAGGA